MRMLMIPTMHPIRRMKMMMMINHQKEMDKEVGFWELLPD
jgi:hypothetical protein